MKNIYYKLEQNQSDVANLSQALQIEQIMLDQQQKWNQHLQPLPPGIEYRCIKS